MLGVQSSSSWCIVKGGSCDRLDVSAVNFGQIDPNLRSEYFAIPFSLFRALSDIRLL